MSVNGILSFFSFCDVPYSLYSLDTNKPNRIKYTRQANSFKGNTENGGCNVILFLRVNNIFYQLLWQGEQGWRSGRALFIFPPGQPRMVSDGSEVLELRELACPPPGVSVIRILFSCSYISKIASLLLKTRPIRGRGNQACF